MDATDCNPSTYKRNRITQKLVNRGGSAWAHIPHWLRSPLDAILSGCGFKDCFGMEHCDAQEHLGGSGPEREQPAQRASCILFWIPARGGVRPAPHFFADSFPGIKGRRECVWRDAKHRDRDGRPNPCSLLRLSTESVQPFFPNLPSVRIMPFPSSILRPPLSAIASATAESPLSLLPAVPTFLMPGIIP